MKLDTFTQSRLSTLFNHLADHQMVDSPDGPFATEMRAIGSRTELNDEQLTEVVRRASGQVALYGDLLSKEAERRRCRTILSALALSGPDSVTSLQEIEQQFPLSDDPNLALAQAAVDILNLLGPHAQPEPTPPLQ